MSKKKKSTTLSSEEIDELSTQFVESLANIQLLFTPVLEGVKGYKTRAMDFGFPEPIADAMALDYHRILMLSLAQNTQHGQSSK